MKHCCGTRILLQDVVTVNSAGIIDQWLLTPFEIRQKRFKSAMKSWRDEWKSARLHLRLRAHQLFHGTRALPRSLRCEWCSSLGATVSAFTARPKTWGSR